MDALGYIGRKELAELLGVGYDKAGEIMRSRALKTTTKGGIRHYTKREWVEEYLERGATGGA